MQQHTLLKESHNLQSLLEKSTGLEQQGCCESLGQHAGRAMWGRLSANMEKEK